MGTKRVATDEGWLHSLSPPKKRQKVLSHAKKSVRRPLFASVARATVKQDASLTQMGWAIRSTPPREAAAMSSGDEIPPSAQASSIPKPPTPTSRSSKASRSEEDEDFQPNRGAKSRTKKPSKSAIGKARVSAKGAERLLPQSTTITQLCDVLKSKPFRRFRKGRQWEQDWESQGQPAYCSGDDEDTENTEDNATMDAVEDTAAGRRLHHLGEVCILTPDDTTVSQHSSPMPKPKFIAPANCPSTKRPYQSKTPRKRIKFEIRSSQSSGSSPQSRHSSFRVEPITFKSLANESNLSNVSYSGLKVIPKSEQSSPLQEKSINIQHAGDRDAGDRKGQAGLKRKDRRFVSPQQQPPKSQGDTMKMSEPARFRRLQSQQRPSGAASPQAEITESWRQGYHDAFAILSDSRVNSAFHLETNDGPEVNRDTLQHSTPLVRHVRVLQDSQDSADDLPTGESNDESSHDKRVAEESIVRENEVEAVTAGEGDEPLSTFDPAYSALDRDAARAFLTQTQYNKSEMQKECERLLYPGDGLENISAGLDDEETDDDLDAPSKIIVHNGPQLQFNKATQLPPATTSIQKSGGRHTSSEPDGGPKDPGEPIERAGDDGMLMSSKHSEHAEPIVPSTPTAPDELHVKRHVRDGSVQVPVSPPARCSHISQVSTVISTQPSVRSRNLRHRVGSVADPTQNVSTTAAETNCCKSISTSSPACPPPWSSPIRHEVCGGNENESSEGHSSMTLESVVDFSLPPPPPLSPAW